MQWTMPPRVLQIVAALISLAAVTAFVLGIVSAPQRGGRLPGERVAGQADAAAPIDAADATPLSGERIEGPPQPTPEELEAKAKAEAEAKAKAEAEAAAREAEAETAAAGNATATPLPAPSPSAPLSTPSDQTLGGPPAADEPPH